MTCGNEKFYCALFVNKLLLLLLLLSRTNTHPMCPVVPFQMLMLSHHSRSGIVLLASCLSHPMKEAWSRCNGPLVHPQNQMKSEGSQHLELWCRWHLETQPLLPLWLPFSSLLPQHESFRPVGNP